MFIEQLAEELQPYLEDQAAYEQSLIEAEWLDYHTRLADSHPRDAKAENALQKVKSYHEQHSQSCSKQFPGGVCPN